MKHRLLKKGWLKREIKIPDAEESLYYSGIGIGTEKMSIGESEYVSRSKYGWFVPEFDFQHDNNHYCVQVRVWPWIMLRSLEVYKNGALVYSEGGKPYRVTRITETTQLIISLGLFLVPLFLLSNIS